MRADQRHPRVGLDEPHPVAIIFTIIVIVAVVVFTCIGDASGYGGRGWIGAWDRHTAGVAWGLAGALGY